MIYKEKLSYCLHMTGQSEKQPGWQNHVFSIPPMPCLITFKRRNETKKKYGECLLLAVWVPNSKRISFIIEIKLDIFLQFIRAICKQGLQWEKIYIFIYIFHMGNFFLPSNKLIGLKSCNCSSIGRCPIYNMQTFCNYCKYSLAGCTFQNAHNFAITNFRVIWKMQLA